MKWYVIVGLALVARFLSSVSLSLIDPSEARFVVASQSMILQDDWFSPKIISNHGEWETYLAKPPLFMWATAASMKFFGMNELASRVPSFIATIGILALLLFFKRSSSSEEKFTLSLVYLTTISVFGFFMIAITDTLLTFFMLGSILFFFEESKFQKLLSPFFAALGILTKGPLAIVLPGGVIVITSILSGNFSYLKKFPWLIGTIVFLFILAPIGWFLETKHPGFLRYYLIEENFNRYISSRPGIRYGTAHREPIGMIWVFGFAIMFPWSSFIFRLSLFKSLKNISSYDFLTKLSLVICFLPLVFFTFAHQILPTYAFLCVPGVVLLISPYIHSYLTASHTESMCRYVSGLIFFLLTANFFILNWLCSLELSALFSLKNVFSWVVVCSFYVLVLNMRRSPQSLLLYFYSLLLSLFIIFTPYLSAIRSARPAIMVAKELGISELNTIHIRSHSMHFYGATEGVTVNVYENIQTFMRDAPSGSILVAKKENKISSALSLVKVAETRGWQLLKKI